MAFGLGFDKAKVLQAAEKYVIQGKIPAAIEEYQKILKKDPKDLMTLNAIGDLYLRAGKNDEALQTFYALAEKSVEGGLVPRAIAVYKRITKIDPEALAALEKLGELYSMQGLMRDSRSYFQQAVEIYVKRREIEKARTVFERVLMLDMDNPKLLRRMAQFYVDTRKEEEAIATFLSAAERYLDDNDPGEALAVLEDIYKLDPINAESLILKGRALLEQGKFTEAIEALESIRDYRQNKGALNSLFHAHNKRGDVAKAEQTAESLFELHGDVAALDLLAAGLLDRGEMQGAVEVYQRVAEKLRARGGLSPIADGLRRVLEKDSKNLIALELFWSACRQSGDATQGREAGERLAQVYQEQGDTAKVREIYAELAAAEPDNPEIAQHLRQLDARAGAVSAPVNSFGDPAPLMARDVAAAPEEESGGVDTRPPREQAVVKNCITECELYLTYRQLPKAIETLEKGLEEVPGDAALLEYLLPLYEQTQQYAKAMKAAEALTEAYVRKGDGERANRYGELLLGYQQKALAAGQSLDAAPAAAEPAAPSESAESQVREVDLSMEWASLSTAEASGGTATASLIEEIEFYLQAGLAVEARTAMDKLREQSPDDGSLAGFEQRLLLLSGHAVSEVEIPDLSAADAAPAMPAMPAELPPVESMAMTEPEAETPAWSPAEVPSAPAPEPLPEPAPAAMDAAPALPDSDLNLEHLSPAVAGPMFETGGAGGAGSGFELALDEHAPPEIAAPAAAQDLSSLAGELEKGFTAPAAAAVSAAPASKTPAPAATGQGGLLDDVFAEFRDEVEEPQPGGGGDLETHYNMGVAFKEMALYDEAIGEFQKVHQIAEQSKDYSHLVQCCSLLANCFLEKGLPLLAVKWYETALNSPGADADSSLALLFEVGAAYEMAGDRPAALKSFMDVYARNIDYRNVAERIRDLQSGA